MITKWNVKRFFGKVFMQPAYAIGVFRKRLNGYIHYLFADGKSGYPEAITLFLTRRCNLRCKMCGQWGREGVTARQGARSIKDELAPAEFLKIVDELAIFRPNITLFGGEPLLYPGCAQLIKYIKEKGMHCLMITNASLLEDVAEELVDSGLDELNVSLDGDACLHDSIRGMPGLADKIKRGIKKVHEIKERNKSKTPFINLQCTVTRYNYMQLESMPQVADELSVNSLTFHNLIFIDRSTLDKQKERDKPLGASSADWEGFAFDPGIDPAVLAETMKRIFSVKHKFSMDFYPNFSPGELAGYYSPSPEKGVSHSARCLSPWVTAYIFPDGEIRPCLNLNYSYGNALTEGFIKSWNGDMARKFRRMLKKEGNFPVCIRCTEFYRY